MPPSSGQTTTRRAFLAVCGLTTITGCSGVETETPTNASPQPTNTRTSTAESAGTTSTRSSRATSEHSPETRSTSTPGSIRTVTGEWSHPGYDAGGTRHVSGTTGPATKPQVAWRVERSGILGFVIAESRLFLLRNTACVALDATSGETVWHVSLPSPTMPATASVTSMPGPVYADETVFVAAGGDLRALRSDDGSTRWTVSLPGGPITDMAVTGEQLYVTTGETDNGNAGYLTAVATADGGERWHLAADQVRQPAGTIASEVAVHGDTVAAISAASDGSYTVNFTVETTDGGKRWTSTGRNHGRALTVAGDSVYTGGFQGYVGPENATSGERRWEANVGPPVKTIAVDSERTYVSTTHVSGEQITAFSLSGDEHWATDGSGELAVADTVYVAQPSTTRALDRADGNERWSLSRSSESNPVGIAVCDSTLFEATENTVRALVET